MWWRVKGVDKGEVEVDGEVVVDVKGLFYGLPDWRSHNIHPPKLKAGW